MRRFTAFLAAPLLFAICTSMAAEDNKASSLQYFPSAKGTHWVYQTTKKAAKDKFPMDVTIEGSWKEAGKSGYVMTQKDKRGRMKEYLLEDREKGISIYKLALKKGILPEVDTRFTPAVPRVIFPLVPGTKVHWEGRLKVATIDRKIVFDGEVVGFEEVTVPAGKFRCIKLHYHEIRGKEVVDEDVWYAPNVGQVRYDGGEYVKELKEFKAP